MKKLIVSLIILSMSPASSARGGAESKIVYSEKTIDFYMNSNDKRHSDALIQIMLAGSVSQRVDLVIGSVNLEDFEPIEISEAKEASLKELVIELLKETPAAVNFSKETIEEGAGDWASEVADGGGQGFQGDDYEDKAIANSPLKIEESAEWELARQQPTRFTFRLGALTETVKNEVNWLLGEGGDVIYGCSSGTYHKIFFEIATAETLAGKKLNRIESAQRRFFLNMPSKERRNLFLGSRVSFHPPADATKQEIQAICDGLL